MFLLTEKAVGSTCRLPVSESNLASFTDGLKSIECTPFKVYCAEN